MFNVSMLSEICELTELIYVKNSRMFNIFIIEFLGSIFAISTSLLTLLAVLFNKTFHFNVRLLLLCFWSAIIITCTGTIINSSYYLIAIIVKTDIERCAWLSFTESSCIALRNIYYVGVIMIVVSIFSLSIERIIATFLYQTYERDVHRWISILMGLSQWILIGPWMWYKNSDEKRIFPYCTYELFNSQIMTNMKLGVFAIQICSFVTIIVLWKYNNKKLLHQKLQNGNISVRYQLRENILTSKILLPLIATITIFVLSGALLQLMLPSCQNDNCWTVVNQLITYCFWIETQTSFLSIAAITLAITLWFTSKTIRKSLFHLLGIKCCIRLGKKNLNHVSPDEYIRQAYFDQLQRQWNNPSISWNNVMCNNALQGKSFQQFKSH